DDRLLQRREEGQGRFGELLIVDRIRLERGDFEPRWEFAHVEAQRPVAVAADEQPATFGPRVDLRLGDAYDRLAGRHAGERRRHKCLVAHWYGAQVQPEPLP